MHYQDKTKDELLKELQKLQMEHNSLKTSYEKDITERKLAEEALRESEERFRRLYQQAPLGYQSLDAEGCLLDVNQVWLDLLRYSRDEVIGHWFGDFLTPQELDAFRQRFSCFKATGEVHVDLEMVQRTGSKIIVHIDGKIGYDEHGQFKQTHCILCNITERKQAEEALKNLLSLTEAILESIHNGILVISLQRTVIKTNAKFAEMWRIPGDILNSGDDKTLLDNVLGQLADPDEFIAKVSELYGKPEAESLDLIYFKDGRIFERISRPMCLGGEPKGRVWSFLDITERKQADEKIRILARFPSENPDPVLRVDRSGRLLFANEASYKFLTWKLQIGEKTPAVLQKIVAEALKEGIRKIIDTEHNQRIISFSIIPVVEEGYTNLYGRDITERKKAEEVLRNSEENMRYIVKHDPNAIAVYDRKLHYIAVSDRYLRDYNVKEEYIIGKHHYEVFPEMPQKWKDVHQRCLAGAIERNDDDYFERPDGSITYNRWECRPWYLVNGEIGGMITYTEVTTERKKAEEALRMEKENFRHSLDDSPLGVRIASIEGNTIYANKTILDFYGYDSMEELQKTPLKHRYTPESYIQAQKRKRQRERGDFSATDYEISIVRKPGEIRHLQVFRKKVLWNGVWQFQIIYNDITERKQAEDALRQSEMKLKILFELLPIGVSIIDAERNVVFVNPALERILNLTKDGFISGDYKSRKYLRPDGTQMPEEEFASIRAIREQRAIYDVETGVMIKDGHVIWTNVNAIPVAFQDWKVVIITTDITKRKLAEEEIRKSKKLLEDLHKHLNEIRENERALISREIHDQIGQSLTALKLDLNGMHKYINTNPEAMTKLEGMIGLVSDTIKDVQRISSDLRPGILDDLGLAAAIEWYSGEFEKRTGIKCSLKLDDSIFGDSQKNLVFFRVLQEALTNVTRHANASSVNIILHQSKQGTTMTIQDNGIGMYTGKAESGKPLGLIGMRERVRQSGGKVDISSRKGQGTKLIIFIPS